jgi:hypothetical protein
MNITVQPRMRIVPGAGTCGGNLISSTKIEVEFLPVSMFKPSIKDCMNSKLNEDKATHNDWSQDVSRMDSPGLVSTLKTPRFPDRSTLTEWLSLPESQTNGLPHDHHDSDVFDASLRALNRHQPHDNSMPGLKLVEFSLTRPDAKRVQLVADFTDWDEAPLDMVLFDRGIWSTTVPLPVGIYAYHFLVDGERYDDPRAVQSSPDGRGNCGDSYIQIK